MAPIAEGSFPMGISKIGPNIWFIKARVVVPNPDPRKKRDDRRRQEEFTGTKAQAEERFLTLRAELRGQRPEARTFGDLLATYLESRGSLTGSQASVYKSLHRDLGAVAIPELGRALKQYHALLKSMPSKRTGRRYSAAGLNRPRTMVAAVLNLSFKTSVISEVPLNAANWPKAKEIPRDRFLDALEAQRLLNTVEAEAPHLIWIARFALLVPCRKSELVNMTPADLDLFHNAIRVHNGTTKNEDGAWKPIPPELVPYFRSIPPESPFLFFRQVKGEFRPLGDFKRAWGRCKRLAGIKNLHFHDTRHIAATNMVDAGTPERVVMDVAGWRTNMLSTYYKSSSKRALTLVRFGNGSGNQVATSAEAQEKVANSEAERAVS